MGEDPPRAATDSLRQIIGMQLREARRRAGLNQKAVAARMGVARATISRVENGRYLPSLEVADRYARALGRPIRLVVGGTVQDPDVRRARALRAVIRAYDYEPKLKDRYLGRDVENVLEDDFRREPTETYLSILGEAAQEGVSKQGPSGLCFKAAVAVASAAYEVIDWGRIREELEKQGDAVGARRLRVLHLRVLRRIWDVVTAADEGRRREIG